MAQYTLTSGNIPPINGFFITGLPLDGTGVGIETSDDLLAAFNSTVMFYFNPSGILTPAFSGANIPLEGGVGYIVIVGTSSNVVFDGDGWCNVLTDPVNGVTNPCP